MSITTFSLIESLLYADRPACWFGLDTADPLVDDSDNGYTLTALGTPTNAASLHTRGDTGASGCRDFNGTTGGYFTAGSVTDVPEGPPSFHASATGTGTSAVAEAVSPGGIEEGDLIIWGSVHTTAAATITGPTGYTQVGTTQNATSHALTMWRKTAVQADTVPQPVNGTWNSSAAWVAFMLVYRGCDPDVANLIFDSAQGVTSSATFHATSSETFPDQAWQVLVWTSDIASANVDPNATNETPLVTIANGNLQILTTSYAKEEAGSGFQVATTGVATTLGYFMLTFGSPRKVLNDSLNTIAANLTIGCLINPDTVAAGTRTIVRKHQAWGLNVNGGTLQFVYRDGGGVDRTVAGPSVTAAVTRRVWVWDDDTNINFLVNGTLTQAARTGTAGYTLNENAVTIAHYNDGATKEFFDGRIDELAIFPASLGMQMAMTHEIAATQGTFGQYITAIQTGRYPRAKVEIAVDSQPTAKCFSYSDVTTDVRASEGLSYQRMRSDPLDRMQAGTMSLTLNNRDRAYDDLAPRRVIRFRVQNGVDTAVIPRFFGYTEAPRFARPATGKDSTVQLTATDSFKALSLNKIQETFVRPTEYAHERLNALLEQVPGLIRVIDEGLHQVIGDDLQGAVALEHAQAVAETDGGVFFADALGRAVFHSSTHRPLNEQTVRATYGWQETSAVYPAKFFEPEVDESRLYTSAAITPASGNVQRAENEAAALEYFSLAKEVSTLHSLDADAEAMAHHIANAYSVPLPRIPSLVLQPGGVNSPALRAAMWTEVLEHAISHRIATIEKPIGGAEVQREHFIEGIAESVNANDWQVTFSLSPTELEGEYFIVGVSQIGSTDVIGW